MVLRLIGLLMHVMVAVGHQRCWRLSLHVSNIDGSSQVALEEAELKLTMSAANFITDVAIDPSSLPDDALQAGSSFPITVKLQTEDSQPVPWDTAEESLTLKLTPPNGNRADVVTLQPSRVQEGTDNDSWCAFAFDSEELTCAGAYTITGEWTEQRCIVTAHMPCITPVSTHLAVL